MERIALDQIDSTWYEDHLVETDRLADRVGKGGEAPRHQHRISAMRLHRLHQSPRPARQLHPLHPAFDQRRLGHPREQPDALDQRRAQLGRGVAEHHVATDADRVDGQVLRIVDVEGNQAVDFLIYAAADDAERYSAQDTVAAQGNLFLRTGSVLLSNEGRPLMTIAASAVEYHDTIGGACSCESNTLRYGHHTKSQHACVDNFLEANLTQGRGSLHGAGHDEGDDAPGAAGSATSGASRAPMKR